MMREENECKLLLLLQGVVSVVGIGVGDDGWGVVGEGVVGECVVGEGVAVARGSVVAGGMVSSTFNNAS